MRISDWSSDVCSSDLELVEDPSRRIMRGVNLLRDAISTSSMAPQDKRLFGSINRPILGGQPGDRLGPVGRVDRTADFDLSASPSRLRAPRPPRVRAPLPAADAPTPPSFGPPPKR